MKWEGDVLGKAWVKAKRCVWGGDKIKYIVYTWEIINEYFWEVGFSPGLEARSLGASESHRWVCIRHERLSRGAGSLDDLRCVCVYTLSSVYTENLTFWPKEASLLQLTSSFSLKIIFQQSFRILGKLPTMDTEQDTSLYVDNGINYTEINISI